MPVEKPERKTEPGSLLSQWWTVLRVLYDKRTKSRHAAVMLVVAEAFRRDFGNGRASISYIKRATRMDDRTIIKTCRELSDWGFVVRHVANGRVTEYVPAWATTKPYPSVSTSVDFASSENTSGDFGGGASGIFVGCLDQTSSIFSRESCLPSPAYKPADGKGNVSALAPAAEAPGGDGFERVWRAYGKYGSKVASRKAFAAITDPDVQLIVARASSWCASAKPGHKRMPFERWLAAEKYDEADRQTTQTSTKAINNTEGAPEMRWNIVSDAAEAAETARTIRTASIKIEVPRNTPLTVADASVEERGTDKWLVITTDKGRVAILLEGGNPHLQDEGQVHLGRLTNACCLAEINDSAELHGRTFMIVGDTFAPVVETRAA